MTIGFNNKTNAWTSKYTFDTSMFSNINNRLYSYATSISPSTDVIYHEHNVGEVNSFYGAKSNSVIAVSFNQNPSENKIYKNFSIEGTKNLANQNSIATFETSETLNSGESRQSFTVGPIRYKGGNLYSYMGRDQNLKMGHTVNYVGTGKLVVDDDVSTTYYFQSPVLNVGSITEGSVNLFAFSFPNQNDNKIYYFNEEAFLTPITETLKYSDLLPNISVVFDESGGVVGPNGITFTSLDNSWAQDIYGLSVNSEGEDEGIHLFAISDPSINGDFLRGQFAEAYMSLGMEPFELYSLNLYYEPTTLDHSS